MLKHGAFFLLNALLNSFTFCLSFFLLPAWTSGDWDPLAVDCVINKSLLSNAKTLCFKWKWILRGVKQSPKYKPIVFYFPIQKK